MSTPEQNTNASNIASLRLQPNYGATLGVKKLLTTVQVGKPRKTHFFRAHQSQDMTFAAMILENKKTQETYLVDQAMAQVISDLVHPTLLIAAIDRQNNVFLIPVPLPGEDGNRNPWHESLAQAVEFSKQHWIRIAANMQLGAYTVFQALGELSEPDWPSTTMDTLLEVAFRGKIITSLEHPVIQAHLGKV
jgi:hypothetical protein